MWEGRARPIDVLSKNLNLSDVFDSDLIWRRFIRSVCEAKNLQTGSNMRFKVEEGMAVLVGLQGGDCWECEVQQSHDHSPSPNSWFHT